MSSHSDRALGALRELLRSSHLAGPSDLPTLVRAAGAQLGAVVARLYLVDYDQVLLVPLLPVDGSDDAEPVSIDGTLAGLAYSDITQHVTESGGTTTLWTPLLDGTERVGVLQLELIDDAEDEELRAAAVDVASLLAEVVLTRARYGDAVEHARRRKDHSVEAELQWRLLPPLTFVSSDVSVAGVVAPANEVAGDCFDYAVNGSTTHVAILDGMGHGLEAALLAAVAVSVLRNCRLNGRDLVDTVREVDARLAAQFGPDRFLTGIIGELDTENGWWRWITCGHPAAHLVRDGKVVKVLDSHVGAPLGIGMLAQTPVVGHEHLEPGDRLVLHTDGVVEARDADGTFFGTDRLVDFLTRAASHARPVAETLRRLNLAILRHQHGRLQDDATTVVVEWRTDKAQLDAVDVVQLAQP